MDRWMDQSMDGSMDGSMDACMHEISCWGEIVEQVPKFKYIGVLIDQTLKFTDHVDMVKNKIFAKMKALARACQYITQAKSV